MEFKNYELYSNIQKKYVGVVCYSNADVGCISTVQFLMPNNAFNPNQLQYFWSILLTVSFSDLCTFLFLCFSHSLFHAVLLPMPLVIYCPQSYILYSILDVCMAVAVLTLPTRSSMLKLTTTHPLEKCSWKEKGSYYNAQNLTLL